MVGLNPEVAHEAMAGLDFTHGVAQALDAGKLFHIDLNDQKPAATTRTSASAPSTPRARSSSSSCSRTPGYDGMRHFDAHAYRTEDEAGVWDFARGCMRTYLILKEKAARWNADAEIRQLVGELRARGGSRPRAAR
jgi:xylose isomerase